MTRERISTEEHIFNDDRSVDLFARVITMRIAQLPPTVRRWRWWLSTISVI